MLLLGEQDFAASGHNSFDAKNLVMVALRQATSDGQFTAFMNKITLSLFCLLLIAASAAGHRVSAASPDVDFAISGNAFLRVCEPARQESHLVHITCMAYVTGVGDGADMMGERFHEPPYCPGPDVENGQKYRVVVKYIKDHPERTDLETCVLIVDALRAAFPCHAIK